MDLDLTTILIIALIAFLAMRLLRRNQSRPRGTYDDPNYRSGGSIGDGPQAYDDPNYRSSGTIGGGPGTITDERHAPDPRGIEGNREAAAGGPTQERREQPRHDDPDHRSGGSIGG